MSNKKSRDIICPKIAYMPQGLGKNLYMTLSVYENIEFFAKLFGLNKKLSPTISIYKIYKTACLFYFYKTSL